MTLVLLHSSGATPALWDRVREAMPGIPVLAPALPGRSGTPWPDDESRRDVAAYARWLMALLDGHGIRRATIAGHSLGGAIALLCALEYPERVAGLGLSGTGARLRVWPQVLEGLADGVRDAMEFFANVQCGPDATDRERVVLRRMLEHVGMEQTLIDLRACDSFDVMDRVGEIAVRTQLFAGDHDVATPEKYAQYLADRIPAARLTMIRGAGHALPIEAADVLAGDLAVLWAATAPQEGETVSEVRAATIRSAPDPETTDRAR